MTRPLPYRPAALLLAPCLLLGCSTLPGTRATPIGEVQGHDAQSSRIGQTVTVEGVITALTADGWYVQDRGDGDDATSDALFVHGPATAAVGDRVRVSGIVAELDAGKGSTRTALEQTQTVRLGTGAVTPTPITAAPDDWERLEGMRVRIDTPLSLADTGDFERHARVMASLDGRLWQPSERAEPGSDAAAAIVAHNARNMLWLEAGGDAEHWPDGLAHARSGSRIDGAIGIIDQAAKGEYRLSLTAQPTLQPEPRPQPPQVPGDVRIAALNLENLFNGDGQGGGFPTLRGARTPDELARQLAKHVATIRGLDADVVALMELENDGYGPESSLAALVDALNAGGGHWRFVRVAAGPGDNAIRVGLIYRDDRVRTQGKPALLEGGPFGEHSRVPLAQAFVPMKGGRVDGSPFVIVANHLKSKGCTEAQGADRDQHDGAGCWNATRVASAQKLDAWLATDPTGQGRERVLIVGDLNAYAREAPVRALVDAGWRDAFDVVGAQAPYSYVYDGRIGRLDHALLSPGFAARLRGAVEWHGNADEPESSGYRVGGEGPWRSSDHDPLLLGFDLRRAP
ncbi:ExeM/NucH family extracellular endonuclease [Lysobacter sp. LF1]|uniref:ExeM/NucH family extracellular endonuclease n=1 Tax=Lysobacter stagni TaxID=3045172 RepID=A0ABT6XDD0_9GAMM|nr:ExeM/NucH family extracellular endonuclease [Lysobacter sp. LF1]MDI9238151.1 ExeM/NucH family extracellular endonuclease [Lysobacter sp. LF1]